MTDMSPEEKARFLALIQRMSDDLHKLAILKQTEIDRLDDLQRQNEEHHKERSRELERYYR